MALGGAHLMLPEEKIMEVLEAYDLTQSLRSAAMLCGVHHHTVARYVAAREARLDPLGLAPPERGSVTDPFAAKVSEWIDRSQAGSGPMWCTASWKRWAVWVRNARPGGWSRR
jgi:hypothetical protein